MNDSLKDAYIEYYGLLYTMAAKILSEHEQREDAIHTVFLKLFDHQELLIRPETLKSYLCKAVINMSINMRHKLSAIQVHHQQILSTSASFEITEEDETREKKKLLRDSIEQVLPEKCKEVFKLKIYEEKKLDEIATLLNISKKTVKNHITKAMQLLHSHLKDKDYFPEIIILLIFLKKGIHFMGLFNLLIVLMFINHA